MNFRSKTNNNMLNNNNKFIPQKISNTNLLMSKSQSSIQLNESNLSSLDQICKSHSQSSYSFMLQTFQFENENILNDLGVSKVSKIKSENKYNINIHDLQQLFIDSSLLQPHKSTIIVAITQLRCLIYPNLIHILCNDKSLKFIKYFLKYFDMATTFNQFQLKCIEAILIYANDEFKGHLSYLQSRIKRATIFTKQATLEKYHQKAEKLVKELKRSIDALNLLLDSDHDILSLSFETNQSYLQKEIPIFRHQMQFTQSSESSSDSIQENGKVQRTQEIAEFLESYLFQQHTFLADAQSVEIQVHAIFDVLQIRLAAFRNKIEMFNVFMEIISSIFAVVNLFGIIIGSNVINPWSTPDPEPGPLTQYNPITRRGSDMPYQIICWLMTVGSLIYVGIFWYFYMKLGK